MSVSQYFFLGCIQGHLLAFGKTEGLVEIFVKILFHDYLADIMEQPRAEGLFGVEGKKHGHLFHQKAADDPATRAMTPESRPVE